MPEAKLASRAGYDLDDSYWAMQAELHARGILDWSDEKGPGDPGDAERGMSVNELSNEGLAESSEAALNAAEAVIRGRAGALLTTDQVAERLGTHRATVTRWIIDGLLPAVRIGRTGSPYRVREEDLEYVVRPVEAKTPPREPSSAKRRREDEKRTQTILKDAGFRR